MKKLFWVPLLFLLLPARVLASPRYVSLAPSTTEILFALGLDKEIVAVSSCCNYPVAARTKPKIGNFSRPSVETILALRPDYIFCTGLEQAPVADELKRLKMNVYIADPKNTRELFATIGDIGRITKKETEAGRLIDKMQADIAGVVAKTKQIPPDKKVKVFVEIWHEPLMTAGKGSFLDELIELAGGINIAHDVPRPYCNFSAEKVIRGNPGCIILAYMDSTSPLELVSGRFGWSNIDAVKNKRVFNDIQPDLILRPGPRVAIGLEKIYQRLYPHG